MWKPDLGRWLGKGKSEAPPNPVAASPEGQFTGPAVPNPIEPLFPTGTPMPPMPKPEIPQPGPAAEAPTAPATAEPLSPPLPDAQPAAPTTPPADRAA